MFLMTYVRANMEDPAWVPGVLLEGGGGVAIVSLGKEQGGEGVW